MSESEIIDGIRQPGRFDAVVPSEAEAIRIIELARPGSVALPRAELGVPYPGPASGVKTWHQVHPAEPAVGHSFPHVKYADWSTGKKGRGGSWGHLFFPPVVIQEESYVVHD